MIHALVSGVLLHIPVQKTSSKGTAYCVGLLKTPGKEGDTTVNFICFQAEEVAELLTLQAGDGLTISGIIALRTREKDGVESAGMSITVDRVLPNKPKPKAVKLKRRFWVFVSMGLWLIILLIVILNRHPALEIGVIVGAILGYGLAYSDHKKRE